MRAIFAYHTTIRCMCLLCCYHTAPHLLCPYAPLGAHTMDKPYATVWHIITGCAPSVPFPFLLSNQTVLLPAIGTVLDVLFFPRVSPRCPLASHARKMPRPQSAPLSLLPWSCQPHGQHATCSRRSAHVVLSPLAPGAGLRACVPFCFHACPHAFEEMK